MSPLTIPRPAPDEADPYYHGYISKVVGENILEQLRGQLEEAEGVFGHLSEAVGAARYAPGKWSVKEVLGHLTDTERVLSYRLLRISRGDSTPLSAFDENAYVPAAHFDRWPIPTLLDGFRRVRESSICLVETTPDECWSFRGVANQRPISARALAYILVGHVTHHLGVLRDRYPLGQSRAPAESYSSLQPGA
jgi:hypothetical protein